MDIKNSQNFLRSSKLVRDLIKLCDIPKDIKVIEIGPGKGIIKDEILKVSNNVWAIEFDKELYENLKIKYKNNPNILLTNEDFLKVKLPSEQYMVISNIPFNISADIFSKLLDGENQPQSMYFIMQTEAMMKFAGAPYYHECLKSLIYKPYFETRKLYDFNPKDFFPIPNANICFVEIKKKKFPDLKFDTYKEYKDFVSFLFTCKGTTFKEKAKNLFSYEQLKRIRKQVAIEFDDNITSWKFESVLKLYNEFVKIVPPIKKPIIKGAYDAYKQSQETLEKIHRNRNSIRNVKNRN